MVERFGMSRGTHASGVVRKNEIRCQAASFTRLYSWCNPPSPARFTTVWSIGSSCLLSLVKTVAWFGSGIPGPYSYSEGSFYGVRFPQQPPLRGCGKVSLSCLERRFSGNLESEQASLGTNAGPRRRCSSASTRLKLELRPRETPCFQNEFSDAVWYSDSTIRPSRKQGLPAGIYFDFGD